MADLVKEWGGGRTEAERGEGREKFHNSKQGF
jgi:hypothetical protein